MRTVLVLPAVDGQGRGDETCVARSLGLRYEVENRRRRRVVMVGDVGSGAPFEARSDDEPLQACRDEQERGDGGQTPPSDARGGDLTEPRM